MMKDVEINNLIFDLDGTLVDSKGDILYCLTKAYQDLNLNLQVDKLIIGPTLEEIIKILSPDIEEDLALEIIREFRKNYLSSNYTRTTPYAGVVDTLKDLKKKGKRLFIATNKPNSGTTRVLNALDLNYFEFLGTPDFLPGHIKTKTEVIAHIMEAFQLEPSQTLMVGDTHTDIIAGKNNSVHTLAFTGGYGELKDLEEQNPTFCISDFKEINYIVK